MRGKAAGAEDQATAVGRGTPAIVEVDRLRAAASAAAASADTEASAPSSTAAAAADDDGPAADHSRSAVVVHVDVLRPSEVVVASTTAAATGGSRRRWHVDRLNHHHRVVVGGRLRGIAATDATATTVHPATATTTTSGRFLRGEESLFHFFCLQFGFSLVKLVSPTPAGHAGRNDDQQQDEADNNERYRDLAVKSGWIEVGHFLMSLFNRRYNGQTDRRASLFRKVRNMKKQLPSSKNFRRFQLQTSKKKKKKKRTSLSDESVSAV